jgi:hypothetical protein
MEERLAVRNSRRPRTFVIGKCLVFIFSGFPLAKIQIKCD